jgi:hypothetical protein
MTLPSPRMIYQAGGLLFHTRQRVMVENSSNSLLLLETYQTMVHSFDAILQLLPHSYAEYLWLSITESFQSIVPSSTFYLVRSASTNCRWNENRFLVKAYRGIWNVESNDVECVHLSTSPTFPSFTCEDESLKSGFSGMNIFVLTASIVYY